MRHIGAAIAMLAVLAAGCGHSPPPPGGPHAAKSGHVVVANANSFFGPASTTVVTNLCAAQKQLEQGTAVVHDSCFSGATNVVLCTDMTSASPVRCTPGPNSLTIAGTGNDLISYARIK